MYIICYRVNGQSKYEVETHKSSAMSTKEHLQKKYHLPDDSVMVFNTVSRADQYVLFALPQNQYVHNIGTKDFMKLSELKASDIILLNKRCSSTKALKFTDLICAMRVRNFAEVAGVHLAIYHWDEIHGRASLRVTEDEEKEAEEIHRLIGK